MQELQIGKSCRSLAWHVDFNCLWRQGRCRGFPNSLNLLHVREARAAPCSAFGTLADGSSRNSCQNGESCRLKDSPRPRELPELVPTSTSPDVAFAPEPCHDQMHGGGFSRQKYSSPSASMPGNSSGTARGAEGTSSEGATCSPGHVRCCFGSTCPGRVTPNPGMCVALPRNTASRASNSSGSGMGRRTPSRSPLATCLPQPSAPLRGNWLPRTFALSLRALRPLGRTKQRLRLWRRVEPWP